MNQPVGVVLAAKTIPAAADYRASAWLGAVQGHRVRSLGVEHFGQTGTIADLYRHHGIDANEIVAAAEGIAPGKPIRYLKALP